MIISFKNILFILIILTTSTSLYGWSFFKNDKTPKERLVVKLENESSTKFSELAKLRQHCKEEYTILSRLKIEKDKEIEFNKIVTYLENHFGVDRNKKYRFDENTGNLYEVGLFIDEKTSPVNKEKKVKSSDK